VDEKIIDNKTNMVYQVNLTYGLSSKEEIYDEYFVQNKKEKKWIEDFEIIELNMSKITKMWYHNT